MVGAVGVVDMGAVAVGMVVAAPAPLAAVRPAALHGDAHMGGLQAHWVASGNAAGLFRIIWVGAVLHVGLALVKGRQARRVGMAGRGAAHLHAAAARCHRRCLHARLGFRLREHAGLNSAVADGAGADEAGEEDGSHDGDWDDEEHPGLQATPAAEGALPLVAAGGREGAVAAAAGAAVGAGGHAGAAA